MNNIISKLQHASQTWETFLATTGGKLEIPKCRVYTLRGIFDKQGILSLEKYYKAEIMEQTIMQHLPNDIPFKYLGVYIIPIGDQ